MEELDALNWPSKHLPLLSELKITFCTESEVLHKACLITKRVFISSHVAKSRDLLSVVLVHEIGRSVPALEHKIGLRGVNDMSVAFCHHEGAREATSRRGVAQMGFWRSCSSCFHHLCV